MNWSSCPQNPGPERDAFLLSLIHAGHFGVRWGVIHSTIPGHTATFHVLADALTVHSVRINVSANLQQQIADLLSASLLTPKLADLLYLQRSLTILPQPGPVTATTQGMLDRSAMVDAAIRQAGGRFWPGIHRGAIVQTVGKHWVLSNNLLLYPPGTKAANYGWHGWDYDVAVTPGVKVAQGVGTVHPPQHTDASQTCVLVKRACTVDGRAHDLHAVLQDPNLCALVSHEGTVHVLRQPGTVPLAPLGLTTGARRHISTLTGAAIGGSLMGVPGALVGASVGALVDVWRDR